MTAPALTAVRPTATPSPPRVVPAWLSTLDQTWAPTAARQPQLAATARRYLDQISVSLSPSSVRVADQALRMLCLFLAEQPETIGSGRTTRPAAGRAP